MCPRCDAPVIDELGLMTTYCEQCTHVWMSSKILNPIGKHVKVDRDLLEEFDIILNRVG